MSARQPGLRQRTQLEPAATSEAKSSRQRRSEVDTDARVILGWTTSSCETGWRIVVRPAFVRRSRQSPSPAGWPMREPLGTQCLSARGYRRLNSKEVGRNPPTPPNPGAGHRPGHVYDEKALPLQALSLARSRVQEQNTVQDMSPTRDPFRARRPADPLRATSAGWDRPALDATHSTGRLLDQREWPPGRVQRGPRREAGTPSGGQH